LLSSLSITGRANWECRVSTTEPVDNPLLLGVGISSQTKQSKCCSAREKEMIDRLASRAMTAHRLRDRNARATVIGLRRKAAAHK
jgi:hypothetical protein